MKLEKEEEYNQILSDMLNRDFGLEYWLFNIKRSNVPIDKARLIESLQIINEFLVSRNRSPYTVTDFKDILKENEIQYA